MTEIVEPGDTITITVAVHNSGRAAGDYLLTLLLDGLENETREVNVLPGEMETVSITISKRLSPGIYQVGLNEWSGEVKVLKPAEFHVENFTLTPAEIQVSQETTVSARITNKGEIEGSYNIKLQFDGETVIDEEITLAGNASENISHKFSKDEPGLYKVSLNGQSKNLKVLKPADIKVSNLSLSPSSVRPGQSVTVTVVVTNSGDVAGDFTVPLTVGGRAEQSKDITVQGNTSKEVSFNVSRDSAGNYTVACGGLSRTFSVMRIERPANGAIITRRMASGEGELIIKNGRDQDALVVLTGTNAPNNPMLAVYVRANSSTTVKKIPDRTYDVYFTHGNDWDKNSNQFTANVSHMKFRDPIKFTTTRTEYTIWEITVHAVAGGTAATDHVRPDQFPSF